MTCDVCDNWARHEGNWGEHHPDCPKFWESVAAVLRSPDSAVSYATAGPPLPPEVNIEQLLQTTREMQRRRREIDESMRRALADVIRQSGEPFWTWALRLEMHPVHLVEILDGRRELNAGVWEAIERYFRPKGG